MRSLLLFIVLLLPGCAAQYVPPPEYVPAPPGSTESCQASPWSVFSGPVRLRQTVFLDVRNQSRVMQGFMLLGQNQEEARLVGMSEFGLKLFDLRVTRQDHETLAMSAALGDMQQFLTAWIVDSVRRIFLPFPPASNPETYVGPESMLVVNRLNGTSVVHECASQTGRVLRISCPEQHWEVDYDEYTTMNGLRLPRQITYRDHRAGFHLVLLLNEVLD